jgi:DNA mismatch repair protein MutS2
LEDIVVRTYKSLEWERLKSFLIAEAESSLGRFFSANQELACDRLTIERLLGETQEFAEMIQARSGFVLNGVPSLEESLQRLQSGAQLSAHDFLDIKKMLKVTGSVRSSLNLLAPESFPATTAYAKFLHALPAVILKIESIIDDGGSVLDTASVELHQLRKEVHKLQNSIHSELTKIIQSSTLAKALQEPIYTQRSGRFVLPVLASSRNIISGIVHDSSASGLTVYIEPMAVVEIANKMRIKTADIEREIARILDELGKNIHEQCHLLTENYNTLGLIDAISARARLSLKYRGTRPEISATQFIEYKEARHPLLVLQTSMENVIANDIRLGGAENESQTLVITGPNTGGKTVLLKTVGIFALMLRIGLLLPVSSGSKASIFDTVFADIGDEQSLEQSLSTFSSHMKNIVHVVDSAKPGTLVLLDEVGAGTDPKEGAALARAILEYLTTSGAMTIATTHYSELKTLAYTDNGFVNGSLAFNDETLSPTYKLRLGVPGSSKATTIARRLGLHKDVIEKAQEHLAKCDQDLQTTISQLESRMQDLELQKELARTAHAEAIQLQEEYQAQKLTLQKQNEKSRQSLASEMESEFQISKEYIRHIIADLQKAPTIAKAQRVQKDLENLRKDLGWMELKAKDDPNKLDVSELKIGQMVRVKSLNQRGLIQSVAPSSANKEEALIVVRAGSMNLKVAISDLELVAGHSLNAGKHAPSKISKSAAKSINTFKQENRIAHQKESAGRAPKSTSRRMPADEEPHVFVRTSTNTIDLRGQRIEEAMNNVEQFVDQCLAAAISPLMIIHGHGTGAVRRAVRDFLDSSNYASAYRPGEAYEGGDGVTIVEFN